MSQIATFGTMAAKAAVRDVGRVLDLPYIFCDGIAKLIPFQPGKQITLRQAREMEPLLAEREQKEEEVRELLALAEALEGLTRNVGMHAGGVLIAPGKLTDFCPLYTQAGLGRDRLAVRQGRRRGGRPRQVRLSRPHHAHDPRLDAALREAPRSGERRSRSRRCRSTTRRPTTSSRTANTTAVFQFESRGMRDLITQAPPTRFEDIIALVALYRPGPMELIPDVHRRARPAASTFDYPDPRLEPILGPTYGVMVYQEQVMQIAQVIGGYTLGAADLLRRAMGKKNKRGDGEAPRHLRRGRREERPRQGEGDALFDLMEKFAGYGFNKSHAAAYALIAYQTAYFKAHHPAAFMAANLSLVMDDTDKVRALYDDARRATASRSLPPDVNARTIASSPSIARRSATGSAAIKGTGEQAIEAIVAARDAGGAFRDLFDFCRRVDKRHVNRRAVEALVKSGAFDAIEPRRAMLFASVGVALSEAEKAEAPPRRCRSSAIRARKRDTRWSPRASGRRPSAWRTKRPRSASTCRGIPMRRSRRSSRRSSGCRSSELQPRKEPALIAGIVMSLRVQSSRRGKMAIVTLDDGGGGGEIVVYNEIFDAAREPVARRPARHRRGQDHAAHDATTDRCRDCASSPTPCTTSLRSASATRRGLRLACNGGADAARLAELLTPFRNGSCPIVVEYRNHGVGGELELPDTWRVNLDDPLLTGLRTGSRPENVRVIY